MRLFYAESDKNSDAYRLLSLAVEKTYSIPCPEIAREPHGKPYFPSRPDIFFSLSHTRGLVLAALDSAPCGCDVEHPRPIRQSVVYRVCAPEEVSEFTFIELWCLKESFYKLLGYTCKPFSSLIFHRKNGLIIPPPPALHARLYTLPGFQLAAVSQTPPPEIIKCLQF